MVTVNSSKSKDILGGIVDLACKMSNSSPKDYRIKIGGDQLGDRADVDWYISVQNHDASVNTKKAIEVGLIRRTFGVYREKPESELTLRVREWDASKDSDGNYRLIWVQSAEDMKARKELAEIIANSVRELAALRKA